MKTASKIVTKHQTPQIQFCFWKYLTFSANFRGTIQFYNSNRQFWALIISVNFFKTLFSILPSSAPFICHFLGPSLEAQSHQGIEPKKTRRRNLQATVDSGSNELGRSWTPGLSLSNMLISLFFSPHCEIQFLPQFLELAFQIPCLGWSTNQLC